jgi:4-amino-4-deoxy-L-arabinose transferase-like glycosyltransferase
MNVKDLLDKLSSIPTVGWLITITLVGAALRLFRLGAQSLWLDESLSLVFASVSLKDSIEAILADGVHPPLYYLVLRLFLYMGQSEEIARLPSAIFGILTIPPVYEIGRLCFDQKVGLVSALLLSLSPFHVWFSQDARMYAMAAFLTLASVYFFLRLLQGSNWRWWIGFVICTALGYYTHYFTFFIALGEFTYLLITFRTHYKLFRKWTLAQAVAFLPLIPWLVAIFTREMSSFGIGWVPRPEWLDLLKTLWNLSLGYTGAFTPSIILSLLPFLLALLCGIWVGDSGSKVLHPRLFLHLWFWLPMIATFLLSLRRPIYIDRLFIMILPAYITLLAWGTMGLKAPWARWTLGAGLVIAMTVGLSRIYFDARIYTKEDWRSAGRHVQSHSQPCDIIVLRNFQDLIPFNYYYQGEVQRVSITLNMITTPLEELVEGHCRLWMVYRHAHESSHFLAWSQPFDLDSQEGVSQVKGWLKDHQGDILEEEGFSGVQVILYDLQPE